MNECSTCEDILFMMATGESAHMIVCRLGIKATSAARHLRRHGHYEEATYLEIARDNRPSRALVSA